MTVIIYLLALYSLIHSFNAFYTAKPQSSLNRKINIQKYNNNNIKYDRTINNPSSSSKLVLSMTNNNKNDDEDDEDREFLGRIKTSYLVNKFKDCRGEDCRAFCSRDEIQALLTCILPPVTPADLTMETNRIIATFSQPDLISADDFVLAASENSFWQRAGSLVVKELIFLDCLNSYYYDKQNMLDNEDYNELKESLTWEGSAAVTMTGQEAHFVTAVAAYRRSQPILNDVDYQALKNDLAGKGSWVVNRVQDPLERLGLDTFMGYLHSAM